MLSVVYMYRYFQLNKYFGPLVVAVRKMIWEVIKFFLIFVFVIYGYGVMQDILLYPGSKEQTFLQWGGWFSNTFLGRGFFHIFGELYDDEIQLTPYSGFEWGCVNPLDPAAYETSSDDFNTICPSSNWVSLFLMAAYVLTVWIFISLIFVS